MVYTIVYEFNDSSISFAEGKEKTVINSSSFSNMVGLCQRSILVARMVVKFLLVQDVVLAEQQSMQ